MHQFEEVPVLQSRFHKINVDQFIEYLIEAAQLDRKSIVANLNVRAANFTHELPWYRDFINGADLVFCDGFGVLLGARLGGHRVDSRYRMTCPDYLDDLGLACQAHGVSMYLLGCEPGVADQAIAKLKKVAPDLRVEGHHGYFEKTGPENDAVIEKINAFKPGLLYVGLGMPLQERWILDNMDKIDAKVFLPLGACLEFYTDVTPRGPKWMTDRGLEWFTRLITEPRRLWKRYLVGNTVFLYRVATRR